MTQFFLNDQLIQTDQPGGMILLDFIRYGQQLKGTKIGCREGDCGACTILVGKLKEGQLHYESATSCLMPLRNAHLRHIVTVEGINMQQLSPVQQAIVEEGGTQCGFCTIGFVMSLSGFMMDGKTATTQQAIASIDGNICRCTGYKSLERAAQQLVGKIQSKPNDRPIEWLVAQQYLPVYFTDIQQGLASLIEQQPKAIPPKAVQIVGGGTDLYVQRPEDLEAAEILPFFQQEELKSIIEKDGFCHIGTAATATDILQSPVMQAAFPYLAAHMKLVSSTPIRNMATLAGNLVNASPIGDLTIFFMALDSQLILKNGNQQRSVPLQDFYKGYKNIDLKKGEIVHSLYFKKPAIAEHFSFEKVCKRQHLDIATVNSACWLKKAGEQIIEARISAGGVGPTPKYLSKTSTFLAGKTISAELWQAANEIMQSEISPISDARGSAKYKRLLLRQFLWTHLLGAKSPQSETPGIEQRIPSTAKAAFPNIDSAAHVQGKSLYLDDLPEWQGTLHAAIFASPIAHGKLNSLDISAAGQLEGVVKIFTSNDISGENQIGGIIPDEPLLAEGEVHFIGQPIALVIAKSVAIARAACQLIKVDIDPLPVITDPREAHAAGHIICPPRTFQLGDTKTAFDNCKYIFEGKAETGGQEHLYLETQGAYAYPMENGNLKISSSTQGPTAVQRTVARVLGIPMHRIEVDVTRLGGGFGGKEDQATGWAVMAALAAQNLQKPVKLVLHRLDDMYMTGKRNPYDSDYKIGLDEQLKIVAFEAIYYQNAGAAADLSPAILERTLFHGNNSYYIPNFLATAYSCRTNLPPNTAFRGFGGPQGMFVIESAIAYAAAVLNVEAIDIQRVNLLQQGDEFPYGQKAEGGEAIRCWEDAAARFDLQKLRKEINIYNADNQHFKKGMALMPICFGISFTNTQMNQARALVHVYHDGSVGVSTGAVEMGQGVNTKLLQVAAKCFSIDPQRVKIETTNTTRVANTSPSAASSTADLNGKALKDACQQIWARLQKVARKFLSLPTESIIEIRNENVFANGKPTELDWKMLVLEAFMQRVNLSAKGHYATPEIHYNKAIEKGRPFAYHVYGTAILTATVDCLRGTYELDSVKVVHDVGASMNRMIDLGQMEGGIVQGIGWMTMEEVIYNEQGKLLSGALSTYKIPDIYAVPKEIDTHFLNSDGVEQAIFRSKATGEPPLMYGIGAYFAIRNAVLAFNPKARLPFSAPITPEKVLMGLHGQNC